MLGSSGLSGLNFVSVGLDFDVVLALLVLVVVDEGADAVANLLSDVDDLGAILDAILNEGDDLLNLGLLLILVLIVGVVGLAHNVVTVHSVIDVNSSVGKVGSA